MIREIKYTMNGGDLWNQINPALPSWINVSLIIKLAPSVLAYGFPQFIGTSFTLVLSSLDSLSPTVLHIDYLFYMLIMVFCYFLILFTAYFYPPFIYFIGLFFLLAVFFNNNHVTSTKFTFTVNLARFQWLRREFLLYSDKTKREHVYSMFQGFG